MNLKQCSFNDQPCCVIVLNVLNVIANPLNLGVDSIISSNCKQEKNCFRILSRSGQSQSFTLLISSSNCILHKITIEKIQVCFQHIVILVLLCLPLKIFLFFSVVL